jgi:DNA-binding NtrC family response regulator
MNSGTDSGSKEDILIVDDEPSVLGLLVDLLQDFGYTPRAFTDPFAALDAVKANLPSVVITDLRMPGIDGLEVLRRVKEIDEGVQVILITGHGSIEDAVVAIKGGAYDFISKPFHSAHIEKVIARAVERTVLRRENMLLRAKLRDSLTPDFARGSSPAFQETLESAALAADSDATLLVHGESGTGKEVIARYVLARSRRADRPFVTLNCAAIPENLVESELFGHRRGAFTGAHQDKKGSFQEAHTGTIFLDEIGELPLAAQSKLLRVLQEGEVAPVGGLAKRVDVRVIAATNKDLRAMIAAGRFREDLFYRLNVVSLFIPPLRERRSDLPEYIEFFRARCARKYNRELLEINGEALAILTAHSWPGNVRELENVMERAVVLTRGSQITAKSLPPELIAMEEARQPVPPARSAGRLLVAERATLLEVLRENGGDRARTAQELGIGLRTLYRRLNEIRGEADEAAALDKS